MAWLTGIYRADDERWVVGTKTPGWQSPSLTVTHNVSCPHDEELGGIVRVLGGNKTVTQ
jgi:hypothetical protein